MKEIKIKQLTITNFKGIKNLNVDFQEYVTDIYGDNGTGKTTIFDAYTWLLFGKNSTDNNDFNIKPLDANNKPLHFVDNVVTGVFTENDMELTLKREHHEKWTKPKGQLEQVFSGNETLYFINNVPKQKKEYDERVNLLVDEMIFKLLTNPMQFNKLHWEKRREILTKMAGNITNDEVFESIKSQYPDKLEVIDQLIKMVSNKTIIEYRKEISANKKLLKENLDKIPTRIDEINKGMKSPVNIEQINKDIEGKKKRIDEIEASILDSSKEYERQNTENNKKQKEVFELKQKVQKLENDVTLELSKPDENELKIKNLKSEISSLSQQITNTENDINYKNKSIERFKKNLDELTNEYEQENIKEAKLNQAEFSCPLSLGVCQYADQVKDKDQKEAIAKFNKAKVDNLNRINNEGIKVRTDKENLEKVVKELNNTLEQLKKDHLTKSEQLTKLTNNSKKAKPTKEELLDKNPEYKKLKKTIEVSENNIKFADKTDFTQLNTEKKRLNDELDVLKSQVTINDDIDKSKKRIKELTDQQLLLSQQIADIDKMEFIIEMYSKANITMVEQRINSMFEMVKFKMYRELVNGGEEPCCETLINGVPFEKDLNNASRINAGIDIINALCKFFGVVCPIIIENAESVNELIYTNSQLIRLIVCPEMPTDIIERQDYISHYSEIGILLTRIGIKM